MDNEQTGETERSANHRPERWRKSHSKRIAREIGRFFFQLAAAISQYLPVKSHVNQVRHRDDENNRAEIDREDSDAPAKDLLNEQRQQNCARASGEHAKKNPERAEHYRHRETEEDDRGETEIAKIVSDTALKIFDNIRRARDVNLEIVFI